MAQAPAGKPKYKRKLRNYLLDKRFQLKYAGLLSGVAALLSITLGLLLWNTSKSLVEQSHTAVTTGQQAVALGQQVAKESKKVSDVVRMSIVKDPMYGDNPELLDEFKAENAKEDQKALNQQIELEAKARALSSHSDQLAKNQNTIMLTLLAVLSLLVVGVGLVGIVVTHKVAGPIFKMTRQFHDLADGHWNMPAPLRPGDELMDFFKTFEDTVQTLRDQREQEIAMLDEALAKVDGAGNDELRDRLDALRSEMNKALHGDEA
jgi:nitrogen fixation/metabolism regulation signal transduction histidine kinase